MKISELPSEEWKEVYSPIFLCSLEIPIEDFVLQHELKSFDYVEDGLGLLRAAVVQIDGSAFWIYGPVGGGSYGFTSFTVRSFELDTRYALELVLSAFGLKSDELTWIASDLGRAMWELWRLDDNDNEVLMYTFHEESVAEFVQQKYEKRGHKQTYTVRSRQVDR